jgi:hypothetical protein
VNWYLAVLADIKWYTLVLGVIFQGGGTLGSNRCEPVLKGSIWLNLGSRRLSLGWLTAESAPWMAGGFTPRSKEWVPKRCNSPRSKGLCVVGELLGVSFQLPDWFHCFLWTLARGDGQRLSK